ncbi:MAG: hypothetical protein ACRDYD_06265 [Acidimicrobiales bacterium]
MTSATTVAPDALPTDYGYEAFLLDARSGADALVYSEGGSKPCGLPGRTAPSVGIPLDQVSVPWKLVARAPDGHSATISAQVLPCDGYSKGYLVEEGKPIAGVIVQRPVGPRAGNPSL